MSTSFAHLQVMNQKSPEVATSSKQDIAMCFKDSPFDQDAAVAEEVSLTLFIELTEQFGQVVGHIHPSTPHHVLQGKGWLDRRRDTAKPREGGGIKDPRVTK